MRELRINELYQVSGGEEYCNPTGVMMAVGVVKAGEGAGASFVRMIGAYDVIPQATRLGGLGGLNLGAGALIGTCIYEHSPTVRETAIGMMESFDLRYLGGRLGGRNNNNKSCNCGSVCHCSSND